ncbi:MAG: type II toxin-antitoxin system RelE/ParE family toxin [Rickettsiales bacterium]
MKDVKITDEFAKWVSGLRDHRAKALIDKRIYRAASGNYGDYKSVGEGVLELRIFYGAGYRIYFVERGSELIVILAGGTKRGQQRDIKKAIDISKLV